MKRRLFNKLMVSVPFLTLPKFKPPKNVVLIADGVKDRSGLRKCVEGQIHTED